ncbi:unnamed protein product [Euphydryas editha]|uniref:Nanos-type domain-containing protein n=1 Tax=Euphydryas editha TaxID=104508 RepID=A0AAU9UG71_EUPED|nr:unnamed protein product [Euphydryas editha]
MFPSKNMDYVGDIQNLFPKTRPIDGDSTFNYPQSPFQSTIVNKSSSSAESISPESYFDNSYTRQTIDRFNLRISSDTPKHAYETPKLSYESPSRINHQYGSFTNIYEPALDSGFQNMDSSTSMYEPFVSQYYESANLRKLLDTPQPIRRQHPIVGRKILGRNLQTQVTNKIAEEQLENSWQSDPLGQTPPETHKNYELFPSERAFEFSSPVKPTNLSPSFNRSIKNLSPMTNPSPTYDPRMTPRMTNSPNWSPTVQPFTTPLQPTLKNTAGASNSDIEQSKMCTLCRKNGETPHIYMSHLLKEKRGNTYVVTCPILRSLVCPICGSSGDNAHTLTYCPILRRNNDGKPLKSTTITLKNTRIKSNGRRRF